MEGARSRSGPAGCGGASIGLGGIFSSMGARLRVPPCWRRGGRG